MDGRTVVRASSTLLVALLGAAVWAGCASSSGGARGTDARAGTDGETAHCRDGCRIRVENRLSRTRIEVSTSRLEGVDRLGVVEANSSGTFGIADDDFEGSQVEVWIRDARTGERIGLYRVQSFPGGQGRVVVGSR